MSNENTMLNFDCRKEIPTSRPVVIRHHYSGVWIGELMGEGITPTIVVLRGRRIYGWSGGRLETSQLAKQGVNANDRLCEVETVQIPIGPGDGLVEIHGTSKELVDAAMRLPSVKI